MATIVNQLIPLGLAGGIYLILGIHFWRTRWHENAPPVAPSRYASTWEKLAIGLTLLLHGAGLKLALFDAAQMRFSFSLAFSLMLWLAVLIYWLESFRVRMDGLQPIVLLGGAAACLLPLLFDKTHPIPNAEALGFRLHFLSAMLAYSLFTLAAAHAVFMGLAEKKLHQRQISRRMASMPPLLAMEALLFRMLSLAFALLTLALGSGIVYSELLFGKPFGLDHKTFFAIVSWLIFATLLAGRRIYGWRGRTALRWTLTGFTVLLLAYVGSRFVAEVLLNRY